MDLAELMQQEYDRLTARLMSLHDERQRIDGEEKKLHNEIAALQLYFDARNGKPLAPRLAVQPQVTRRPGIRKSVLDLISSAPSGMSRQDLLARLGSKDDKSLQQAVSNALVALKKKRLIDGAHGRYYLPGSKSEPSVGRV